MRTHDITMGYALSAMHASASSLATNTASLHRSQSHATASFNASCKTIPPFLSLLISTIFAPAGSGGVILLIAASILSLSFTVLFPFTNPCLLLPGFVFACGPVLW